MTHGCTNCGYGYMGKCVVYEDGTCKRDREEAYIGGVDNITNTSNPFPYVESRKQTNYEKIKSMGIDEMTTFFCKGEFGCEGCAGNFDKDICASEHRRIKVWLKSKAEEEETT